MLLYFGLNFNQMKKLLTFTLFCYSLGALTSCSKSLTETPGTPSLNTLKNQQANSLNTTTDLTALITGQTWLYYEYFTSFNVPATTLAWKTSRSSNTLNLSLNRVHFNADGTYSEITENGTTLNGTWTFLNNQTGVQVINSLGTFVSTIQQLTTNRYEWLESNEKTLEQIRRQAVQDQKELGQAFVLLRLFRRFHASLKRS